MRKRRSDEATEGSDRNRPVGEETSTPSSLRRSVALFPFSPSVPSYFVYQSALICTYFCQSSGMSSSGRIAWTGHSSTHRPQSIQVSGSM